MIKMNHTLQVLREHLFKLCPPQTLFEFTSINMESRGLFKKHRPLFEEWYQTPLVIESEMVTYQSGTVLEREIELFKNSKNIYKMMFYRNGKLHGSYLVYDIKGNLEIEARYRLGVLDGPYKIYKQGKLSVECNYENNELHGEYKMFNGDKLDMKVNYINGKKFGYESKYYSDGGLKSLVWFCDGKEDGDYKTLFQNGLLREEGNYVYGVKHGVFVEYDGIESIKSVTKYDFGIQVDY